MWFMYVIGDISKRRRGWIQYTFDEVPDEKLLQKCKEAIERGYEEIKLVYMASQDARP